MVSCFFPRARSTEGVTRQRIYQGIDPLKKKCTLGGEKEMVRKLGVRKGLLLVFSDDSWFGCPLEILSCLLISSNAVGSTSQHISEFRADLNYALLLKKA